VRENDATGEVWNENTVRTHTSGPRKQEVLTWLGRLTSPLRPALNPRHVLSKWGLDDTQHTCT